MADFFTGDIFAFRDGKGTQLATGLRGADGIARDRAGRLYVSSWTQGKVWRLDADGTNAKIVVEGLQSAADFFLDEDAGVLVVPDMKAGTLTFAPL